MIIEFDWSGRQFLLTALLSEISRTEMNKKRWGLDALGAFVYF